MARYIDADALIAEYDRVHIGAPGGARKLMVDAPTADVVEVVRCKDCRCWDEGGFDPVTNHHFGYCRHYQWQDAEGWDRETNDNDFCSYGEKKGGVI